MVRLVMGCAPGRIFIRSISKYDYPSWVYIYPVRYSRTYNCALGSVMTYAPLANDEE